MIKFLTGPIGIFLGKSLIFLLVGGIIWSAWNNYTQGIVLEERLKNENAQLVRLNNDMLILQKKTEELDTANREILVKLSEKNDKVIERHNEVRTYIQSDAARASNRESSEVIKNTIRMLKKNENTN